MEVYRQEDSGVFGDEVLAAEQHVLLGHAHSASSHRVHPHALLHIQAKLGMIPKVLGGARGA